MSSKADCVHCRRGCMGVSVPWALGFTLWNFKLSHFVINCNGQGHNVRPWSGLDLSGKTLSFRLNQRSQSVRKFPPGVLRLLLLQELWERCCPGRSCPSKLGGLGHSPFIGGVFAAELYSWTSFRVKLGLCSGSLLRSRFSSPEGCYKLVCGRTRRLLGLGWPTWLQMSLQRSYIHGMNCLSYVARCRPSLQTTACAAVALYIYWGIRELPLGFSLKPGHTSLFYRRDKIPQVSALQTWLPCLPSRLLQPPATSINVDALLAKCILAHFLSCRILSLLRPTALQCQIRAYQYPSLYAFYAKPSFGLIICDCSFH